MDERKTSQILPLLVGLAAALFFCGCRNLDVGKEKVPGIVLPKSQMESDSIALRVAVAELDNLQKEEFESFIATTDPKLPLDTRQLLDNNGLRVSVISDVNTSRLQRLLEPRVLERQWLNEQEAELAAAGKLEPVARLETQRHVEKKRGETFSVEISPIRTESIWQMHAMEGVRSDRARLAQCQMRITSWPQPDGSVKVEFVPEIHHGLNLSRIGVDGQSFAVRNRRDIKELRELAFEVSVRPGETIVVAPTNTLERMGKLFFNAADEESPSKQVVDATGTDDVDTSEFFPMLDEEAASLDAPILVGHEKIDDVVLEQDGRPKPWQRFLLVRVVDVTPAEIH